MSAEKPKHHQVPQMLIGRWANDEGRVRWRHKRLDRWDPKLPAKIMRRGGAYSLPLSSDPEAAERALSGLERAAGQVLGDLIEDLRRVGPGRESYEVGTWDPSEEEVLREFIVCQYGRSEAVRRSLTTAKPADELIEEVTMDIEANPDLSGKVEVNRAGMRRIHQQLLVQTQLGLGPGNRFVQHFVNMEVAIGMVDLDAPKLALTDAPAMKTGPRRTDWDDEKGNDVGIPGKDPEVRLVLPIAGQYALMLKMREEPRGPRRIESIRRTRAIEWLTHMAQRYEEVIVPWEDDETAAFFEAPNTNNPHKR